MDKLKLDQLEKQYERKNYSDYYNTDCVKCPYCNHDNQEPSDIDADEDDYFDITCESCSKTFVFKTMIVTKYESLPYETIYINERNILVNKMEWHRRKANLQNSMKDVLLFETYNQQIKLLDERANEILHIHMD